MNSALRSGVVAACEVRCQSRSSRWMMPACGNLGAGLKPPCSRSKRCSSCCAQQPQRRVVQRCGHCRRRVDGRQGLDQRLRLRTQFLLTLAVVLGHARQQRAEARHAEARLGRKVRATEEGPLVVMRQEHGQRPAATAAREQLVRDLVDAVDVGPLLAVHLDVDEQLVHHRRGGRILEGFMRHHMAPVAGRVADRQQDRLAAGVRRRRRLLPMDTSPRDCGHAAAGRGWSRRQAGWPAPVRCRSGVRHPAGVQVQ